MLSRFWHTGRVSCLTLVVMVAPIGLEITTNVAVAQEGAGSVSVSDAEGFIGDWVLTYDARGTTRQMNLAIKDMDGKVAATVSDERSGDQDISKIAKSGDALELTYERDFGGQTIDVVLTISLADGALTGEMSFAGGQFTVDVAGAKAGAEGAAESQEAAGDTFMPMALDASEAQAFLGDWTVEMNAMGQDVEMTIKLRDVGGKLAGIVSIDMEAGAPGPAAFKTAEVTDSGITLNYEVDFGQVIDAALILKTPEDGKITGIFEVAGGAFSADLAGTKTGDTTTAEGPAEVQVAAGDSFTPMELDASEAQAFLGDWTVEMNAMGQDVEMIIKLRDVGGKLAGIVSIDMEAGAPGPAAFKTAKVTDTGITLNYEVDFGQPMDAALVLKNPEDGKIAGRFEVGGGAFSAELAGTKTGDTTTAVASTGEASGTDSSSTRRRSRRRRGVRASLAIGDNNITVTGGTIPATHADFEQITSPSDGVIVRFVESAALKLRNDLDITFGDTVIETGIHAENYPGVYSIWLKKVGDEWHLVFNKKSDVWGTQHDPEADVAEITIESGPAEEAAENLTLKLEADGENGGILMIIWGDQQWTAKFTSS